MAIASSYLTAPWRRMAFAVSHPIPRDWKRDGTWLLK